MKKGAAWIFPSSRKDPAEPGGDAFRIIVCVKGGMVREITGDRKEEAHGVDVGVADEERLERATLPNGERVAAFVEPVEVTVLRPDGVGFDTVHPSSGFEAPWRPGSFAAGAS